MSSLDRSLVRALSLVVASSGLIAADLPTGLGRSAPAPPITGSVLPLPPAAIDNKLTISGDEFKARKSETRMTVGVQVNGRGPYQFLVDSGADTSVVGLRIARELALPLGTPTILNGSTDRAIVDRVLVDRLALGHKAFVDLELPALQELNLGAEGMIGIDALADQRLMMDFEKRVIQVEDARRPEKIEKGAIVIIAKRRRGQLILTEVNAAGVKLDAVIDTGSEITIGNLALRDKLMRHSRDKFGKVEAIGVTGKSVEMDLTHIAQLKVGPIILKNVPMAFADVPLFKLFGLSDQPALLLGTDLLENFRRVSLDFHARRVRFQLKSCATSGIAVSTAPEGFVTRMSSDTREACET